MAEEETKATEQGKQTVEAPAGGDLLSETLQKLDLALPATLDLQKAVAGETLEEKLPAEIAVFVKWALAAREPLKKVDSRAVQAMIDQVDALLSSQLAAVYHHPDFQKMESSWRSLKFLVDRTNFRDGKTKLEVLNVSKDDLLQDFQDAPELPQSGLYRQVYTQEYDQFGGEPYGAMVANFEFGRGSQDVSLLQKCSQVAAGSHCPFISAVGTQEFFGFGSPSEFNTTPDIKAIFDQAEYTKWKSFRDSEDARYVGLCCPRFLLRLPYGTGEFEEKIREFSFSEGVTREHHGDYLWGNAAFALAGNMVRSHDKFGWCTNIVGPQSGGSVEDLPVHLVEEAGEMVQKCPTETLISDTNELALSESGLVPLVFRKNADNACFFGAQSVNKPKKYNKADATASARLSAKLFNVLMHARFSHYLKVIQRENIGSFKEAADLEKEMNEWLKGYVTEDPNAPIASRSKYPLKKGQVTVTAREDDPGWYSVKIFLRPWFKLEGMDVDISLVTRMPTGKK